MMSKLHPGPPSAPSPPSDVAKRKWALDTDLGSIPESTIYLLNHFGQVAETI